MKSLLKRKFIPLAIFLLPVFALMACQGEVDPYTQEINEWHENRIETLKQPMGWLKLDGLYWLEEGESTFGTARGNDVMFPESGLPGNAGVFIRENDEVRMIVDENARITHEGEEISDVMLYEDGESKTVKSGDLTWMIIQRDELVGVRLYNERAEAYQRFRDIPRYRVSEDWKIEGRFEPFDQPFTINIQNILGQLNEEEISGMIYFEKDGEEFSLLPIDSGERFFLIIADQTNRGETYAGGRFIYIDKPQDGNNTVTIDLNMLYNPPCALSPYSTCPMPPEENNLALRIEAGEKLPRTR